MLLYDQKAGGIMDKTVVSKRLLSTIEEKGMSYGEVAKLTGIPKSAVHRYSTGETVKIPIDRVEKMAEVLGVSAAYLMGWDNADTTDQISLPDNILPLPQMRKIPLLGTIACGEPILATENIECNIDIPDHIHADFALRCKGDSMVNARIMDGDIVYIRQQPDVENGEIAAVLIGDEATLKRVYKADNQVTLMPENSAYAPRVYTGDQLSALRILGKAVAFVSKVR
mgnify:CR=1 FL=1